MRQAWKLRDDSRRRAGIGRRVTNAVGWFAGAVFLAPVVYLVLSSLGVGTDLGAVVTNGRVLGPLGRSLLLAATTAISATTVGLGLAWLLVRTDMPMRNVWQGLAALPLVIPSYVGASGFRAAFGAGGLIEWIPRPQGFLGSVTVLTLLTYPYVYLPVAIKLAGLPGRVEDAALLLGDNSYGVVRRIVLPQISAAAAAGGSLVFLYAVSDFGAVSLMRFDTLTRAIYAARLADKSTALALGTLLAAMALAVAAVERRLAGRAIVAGASSGARQYRLGKARPFGVLTVAAVISFALILPIVVFATWWYRGDSAAGLSFAEMFGRLGDLAQPALNSATAGVVAGAVAMVILLPVAYGSATRTSRAGGFSSVAIASAFALPGLVIALALVYWTLQGPAGLYQTYPVLMLAYVIHFGVQSHRASTDAIAVAPQRYDEAARLLGAPWWRRFVTVELPLIAPGVVAGGGLVMLSTLKELPATLLLAPIGFDTLATRVWGAAEDGFLAEVGATSLVLILLSGILTWLLVLRPSGVLRKSTAH